MADRPPPRKGNSCILLLLGLSAIVIALYIVGSVSKSASTSTSSYGSSSANSSSNSAPAAASTEPFEYQLATINAGGYVSHDDITVTRFRYLLNNIRQIMQGANFSYTQKQVADLTVYGQQTLRDKYGKSITLLDFMEQMNKIVEQSPAGVKYEEMIASYVVLYGRQ